MFNFACTLKAAINFNLNNILCILNFKINLHLIKMCCIFLLFNNKN